MSDIHQRLAALGLAVPEILLPRRDIDLQKWAVIACDQFTQDRAYWEQVKEYVGDAPSTLNCVFPEVYLATQPSPKGEGSPLEYPDRTEWIGKIHRTMKSYLNEGIFAPSQKGCIYIERSTPHHPRRRGLLVSVDLDSYDWSSKAQPLIRATESTVPERLPPRMDIRRGAPLESPHIIILIDDDEDTLLSGLTDKIRPSAPAYQSPLMKDSGHISGWLLDKEDHWTYIAEKIEALARRAETRYGSGDPQARPFLYAVGDGNHSLASAKAVWEEYKQAHAGESSLVDHPLRRALVEIENIYDPGIEFEPIHRVIFNTSINEVLNILSFLPGVYLHPVDDGPAALSALVKDPHTNKNRLGLIFKDRYILLETDARGLATVSLQPLLDSVVRQAAEKAGTQRTRLPSIDYIHGEKELFRLADREEAASTVGILLPPVRKQVLFETVARSGPLPRKSFSMGEAAEKRFYLECRRLFG